MSIQQKQYRFEQIHIDVARNATDDFNPFHDPCKWNAIHGNPFGSPIVLGFQLEALIESQIRQLRQDSGEDRLITTNNLRFANYQFAFAGVVKPGEKIRLETRPTLNKIATAGQIANRIIIRKEGGVVILGYQRESKKALVFPDADFSAFGDLRRLRDRTYKEGYFLKRKFMNTSNGKNFLVGSLVDQHLYFDELEDRVEFPGMFPAALLSCALLEKIRQKGYDFYAKPMVYTSHAISIDRRLLSTLKSNDCLHMLARGPQEIQPEKGLGKSNVRQTAYDCFGLINDNGILYRAKVHMALLEDVIQACKS